ncbi:MAG: hypothetical protein GX208_02365 [Firmicutes bacterium]|nr:hypothetical protein [Bacillota bacterium]
MNYFLTFIHNWEICLERTALFLYNKTKIFAGDPMEKLLTEVLNEVKDIKNSADDLKQEVQLIKDEQIV